ncbi:P-loop containing nucleoside triphosphate hydrolase protein [Mycena latifolia]|nr:P-loop containing nucleoside triphosphate hydrolase protein [Mycena latifolia]
MVSASLKTPFLDATSTIMGSLLTTVKTVKRNQQDCIHMLEKIHQLLYAVIHVHINSGTSGELPPKMLNHLGKFTETLHKVHAFVEAQQEKSKLKHFFRQGELRTLLKDCQLGLEQALEAFKIQGVTLLSDMAEMQKLAQKAHEEVLEMISALSNGEISDRGSSISRAFLSSENSLNSLSLLPSEPKIFHGRQSEVSAIIQTFGQTTPRIAVLGPGGMGKTSLARAILHHPEIIARYDQHRGFVACDTASSIIQLAGLIGAHLGLKQGNNLTQPVIHHFASSPPSLLILDNLETIWEARESRVEVEKFLALLADIDHLALIITMRGAERPANIPWTHPFLEPLKPLTQEAARQTFIDITDNGHALEDIDQVLNLVDNMPLAIDLIAHLVDFEGFSSVLDRWETERTSLLSEGYDRGSNLDLSISLSLESPRILSLPESQELLSLLSILPDGLSDAELVQSKLPIDNILACKSMLLCTSLAYTDDQKRLKSLVPIREYIQRSHSPTARIIQPLRQHFQGLLEVHETYHGTVSNPGTVARIASNHANIHNILVTGLNQENPDLVNTIYCACHFDRFNILSGRDRGQVMDLIPSVLPHPRNHRLEVYFTTRLLASEKYHHIVNAQNMVDQALESLAYFDDPDLKCLSCVNYQIYTKY